MRFKIIIKGNLLTYYFNYPKKEQKIVDFY